MPQADDLIFVLLTAHIRQSRYGLPHPRPFNILLESAAVARNIIDWVAKIIFERRSSSGPFP